MPNSYVEYTTGGSSINELQQAVFSYSPIEVISANDVKAFAVKSNGDKHQFTISSRNATAKTVTLSELPSSLSPSVSKVRIYRQTSSGALVDFVDGARLTERDLDTAYKQSLLVGQEVQEDAAGNNTTLNNVTDLTLGGMTTVTNLTATGTVSLPSNTNLSLNNLTTTGTVQIPSGTHANHFYREGTFTFYSNSNLTFESGTNIGRYTKIGNLVHVQMNLKVDTVTSTNHAYISGLPYAAVAHTSGTGNSKAVGNFSSANVSSANTPIVPTIENNSATVYLELLSNNGNFTIVTNSYFQASSEYNITISYITA